ncbi:MAG TPA: lipopolysaccharide biosynthesis protein [Verrucomicrobiae bacterium]|nr:lipopolysaccharide biosynthesis protein [Verrucomicrobiae bacterium]
MNRNSPTPPEAVLDAATEQVAEDISALPSAPAVPSDRLLVRSIAWSAAGDWGTQIFTWLAFLEVMRVLTPADFGIAALAGILMPYMGQLTGLGMPRAVVAIRDLSEDQLAQMNTLSLLSATTLFLFGVAIAKPFAAFFRTPALAPVFIVACSGLIMSALCAVPNATLAKQMRFRLLSILSIVCTLTAAAATLAMALLGLGYWALLLGNMLSGVIKTVVIQRARPTRLAWPRLKTIREPLRFGWQISVSLIAMNSYQRLDNFVAGRVLGPAALGFYGNAWELANVPIEKVSSLVTTVIPSFLSAVQDQPAALRRYLRGLTETIALAAFPATVGLSLVAHEAVPLVLGHKWDGMVAPLQVLCFYAAFRAIVALLPKVLVAIHKVRFVMWNDLAALALLPIAFFIGSRRGTAGIAWAWVVAYPFIVLPLYWKTFRAIGMSLAEYLRALRPAVSGTIVMILCVEAAKHSLAPAGGLLFRLTVEVGVGMISYVAPVWLLHRDRVMAVIRVLQKIGPRRTRRAQEPVA